MDMKTKMIIIFIAAFAILIAILFRNAEGAVFYQPINYIDEAQKNVWYNTTISFNPEAFSSVASAKIILFFEQNSETKIKAKVNNTDCYPDEWNTKGGAKQYRAEFDCSNIIKNRGNYQISILFDSKTGTAYFSNIYGYAEIYYSDIEKLMKKQISVFGTEYLPEGFGTIFLQILDSGMPVNNASCILTSYYPDKTKFIDKAPMYFLEDGLYFYDIQAPEEPGTYMLSAFCWYVTNKTNIFPYYLKINSGLSGGDFPSGLYARNDHYVHTMTEISDTLDFEYWINATLPSNASEIHLNFFGSWDDKKETVEQYVYNYNTSSWDKLPNPIRWSSGHVASNNIIKDNLTSYFNNSILKVRFKDTSPATSSNSNLTIDFFQMSIVYTAYEFIDEIRGGGELHIHNITGINITAEANLTETNALISSTNSSIFSKLSDMQEEIASTNSTINFWGNLLNATIYSWGSSIMSAINSWGNALENKIDQIILGNVTIRVDFDYDKMAMYVLSYLKGAKFWCWWVKC